MNGMSSNVSNLSTPSNGTDFVGKIYVFRPIPPSTKLLFLLLLIVVGIVAFGGNVLILLFLRTKERVNSIANACSFQKNFNFYIKSLAISDVLCSVIPIPSYSINLYIEWYQDRWGCMIGRYILYVFPCVTANNLLAISFGKFFATRKVPRTFSHSTVKKVVMFAWVGGFMVSMIPAATLDGMRYDVNDTHYTVVCRFNNQYPPFRIVFLSFTLFQYVIPSFILITINMLLVITVWKKTRRTINVTMDNGIRSMARTARIRCVYVVVALTLAFVTPYFFYLAYVVYNMVAQPDISFETDQTIRTLTSIIAFSNSAINVIIYLVQMKDFRTFLKEQIFSRFSCGNETNWNEEGVAEMQPQGIQTLKYSRTEEREYP